ncbi:MAG: UDP-4-amino-4,6-dideoxy-N-acetyl-beta-L-altrosamine N-acetyltransferase [Woeseiaceae bacterium]|nr:UDP-4-amino-4,6-dideoxy-N-acetyl-beta-L-altrosamine N-acetyltransferase [Woeseiaceae bacterium]
MLKRCKKKKTSDGKMTQIILREITKCTEEQKKAVREVRNQKSVRKSMYTEHEIPLNEHLAWVERLQHNKRQIVFIVLVDDLVSGVVSVDAIDRLHLKSDWAFYLDASARGGLGSALEFSIIEFVFNDLELEKLNCEVIETNEAVVRLHKKFGFAEEGFRRENIIKNEERMGVFFLGLTKNDWLKNRDAVSLRYGKVIEKFNLEIEYETS